MSIRKTCPTSVSSALSTGSSIRPMPSVTWLLPSIAAWVAGSASTANTVAAGTATVRAALTFSGMQGGPVNELLSVAVECPALDQLEVEVGRARENRFLPGPAGEHGEDRHLDEVDQAGDHQRMVHRQAAVRAQRHLGLLLKPGDDVDGVTAHDGRVRPVKGLLQRAR